MPLCLCGYESFMQNKPNLLDTQMNVSSVLTRDYENEPLRRRGENKPKQTQSPSAIRNTQYEIRDTNPIKPNFKRATFAAKQL